MANLNDAKFEALRNLGFTGAVNDMELQWLQSLGAISNELNDAWLEVADTFDPLSSQINDCKFAYMLAQGAVGEHINDIELNFWENLNVITLPTLDWHYPATNDAFNTKGAGSIKMLRASIDQQIKASTTHLVELPIDTPNITPIGLVVTPEDESRHWWANDVTQRVTPNIFTHKGWEYTGLTRVFIPSPSGVPALPDNGYGEVRQEAVNSLHQLRLSGANLVDSGAVPTFAAIIEIVGDVPYLQFGQYGLNQSMQGKVTFDTSDGTIQSVDPTFGNFKFYDLGDNWFYCSFYSGVTTAAFGAYETWINLLDEFQNTSFIGDVNNGINIHAASYGQKQFGSLYAPVIANINANITRIEPLSCYSEATQAAAIDSDFQLYFCFVNRQPLNPVGFTIIAFYGDGDPLVNGTGWAIGYDSDISSYNAIAIVGGVFTSAPAFIAAASPALDEKLEIMLEVKTGQPQQLTINGLSGAAPNTPTTYPPNNDRFYQYVNDPSTSRAYGHYVNMKRAQGVGYTLQQMRDAV